MDKGIIYKITCNNTNKFYIGSTSNKLNNRITQHKIQHKYYLNGKNKNYISSFEILKENNYIVEIIEQFNYNSKVELLNKERMLIYTNKDNGLCVNIVGRNGTKEQTNKNEKKNEAKNVTIENIIEAFDSTKFYNKIEFMEIFNTLYTFSNIEISNKRRMGMLNSILKKENYLFKSKHLRVQGKKERFYYLDKKIIAQK